jgi:small subunit ribosomal protein S16
MIRLQRIGRKHDPAFRVIVTEKTTGPKTGKYIERVGFYHAKTGEKSFNKERILYWMEKGAKVSQTMHNFLVDEGVIKEKKILAPAKKKEAVEEAPKESQVA